MTIRQHRHWGVHIALCCSLAATACGEPATAPGDASNASDDGGADIDTALPVDVAVDVALGPVPDARVVLDDEPWRPQVHLSPPGGWLSDPAGLVVVGSRWHLFYQHFPDALFWGPMHWGHLVSEAAGTRWKVPADPVPISPDTSLGWAFTGSAVVDADTTSGLCAAAGDPSECIVIVHTHHGGATGGQKQSLVVSSDGGATFTPYASNPVLADPAENDFRDPRVHWHQGSAQWVMILAVGRELRFYLSSDLIGWVQAGTFAPDAVLSTPQAVLECPEWFEAPVVGPSWVPTGETRHVVQVDVTYGVGEPATQAESWAFVGDLKISAGSVVFTPNPPTPSRVDFGADFYASQTFTQPNRNPSLEGPVWLAWANHWAYSLILPTDENFRGVMSMIREVVVIDGGSGALRIAQRPAPAWTARRLGQTLRERGTADAQSGSQAWEAGRVFDAELTLTASPDATAVHLDVLAGPQERTRISWYPITGRLVFDRSQSTAPADNPGLGFDELQEAVLPAGSLEEDGSLTLRVAVDRSIVEVFAAQGRIVFTNRVFPSPESTLVRLSVDAGGVDYSLDVWRLDTLWAEP